MSNYVSQNIGAGKQERIAPGAKAGLIVGFSLCVPVIALYFGFPHLPVGLFMDKTASADAMLSGIQFLRIVAPFYMVVCIKLVVDGVLRGAGLMKAFMFSTFADLLLRVGLCILFSVFLGYIGIWCAWPVGWTIGTAISVLFYLRYVRSFKK